MNKAAIMRRIAERVSNKEVGGVLESLARLLEAATDEGVAKMWEAQILQLSKMHPEIWKMNVEVAFDVGTLTCDSLSAIVNVVKELGYGHRLPEETINMLLDGMHDVLENCPKAKQEAADIRQTKEPTKEPVHEKLEKKPEDLVENPEG